MAIFVGVAFFSEIHARFKLLGQQQSMARKRKEWLPRARDRPAAATRRQQEDVVSLKPREGRFSTAREAAGLDATLVVPSKWHSDL